jgi:hypothetical protein
MAKQIMTINEVEKRLGVTSVDKTHWMKAVYVGVNALRTGLAMWGVGGTGVGALGGSLAVGGGMAIGAISAPVFGLIGAFLAIGLPVAKAKEVVSKKAARHGYAIGVALALFNHDKYFASTFLDNTDGSPGVAPSYMHGIYKVAYNTSLILGYCSAGRLSVDEKTKMGNGVIAIMLADAEKKGYKLNTSRWTERDGIQHFARTFINRVLD